MRKKVIVLVSLLFVLVDMYAQTFYYDTTQVFYAQRYVCDVTQESKSVRLYSKSNKFTEVEAVNKETGAEITDAERKEANFVDDSQLWGKCLSILNESFSEEERTRVQGCKFIIILRVDTNTGIIRDVEYRFPAVSMLATVPVSVWMQSARASQASLFLRNRSYRREYIDPANQSIQNHRAMKNTECPLFHRLPSVPRTTGPERKHLDKPQKHFFAILLGGISVRRDF